MKNEQRDIILFGETQKQNTGGMERGNSLGNEYIVFFSTGVAPKFRETIEQQREEEIGKKESRAKGKCKS